MPCIFDNIQTKLLDGLRELLRDAESCSFCVGYLNLRGWSELADVIEALPGGDERRGCRLLVGMYRPPEEEMKALSGLTNQPRTFGGSEAAVLYRRITESFKTQLEVGVPSAQAETALRRLAAQIRARKVFVKAFLRYPLHAKLYLVRRNDPVTPLIAFVGSSNLTLPGLSHQGELNVNVVEQDAALKLQQWFDDRWGDKLAVDLGQQLAELIEKSWARVELVRPYLVYLKIAHHLCKEAREGERQFRVPKIFRDKGTPLLDFQEAAVSLAAHYLHRHGGVLLGDVVGLGKTLMATAVARVLQEDDDSNTLIICPPKLQELWERHVEQYQITGRVLSLGMVIPTLNCPDAPRYRLVIIDESHNLRNREGQRYRAIRDYIERNQPRVMLLTATPYNKQFTDLSNQLRLFVDEDQDLHVRPERFFQQWIASGKNEADFIAQFQASPSSLRAFDQSQFPEDWRDLMRLFLVRRTRQFIINHYAKFDKKRQRYYVLLNGKPTYFPVREPRTITFPVNTNNPCDQYAQLFDDPVVAVIENLFLPRYGLANYLVPNAERMARDEKEKRILNNLNRAGRRLIGFCRTNLFKRMESSGYSFLLSVHRHILRNFITLFALENNLPVPIGTQDAALLDTAITDADDDFADTDDPDETTQIPEADSLPHMAASVNAYRDRAEALYELYSKKLKKRFGWLEPKFFRPDLARHLRDDAKALLNILKRAGMWNPNADAKLHALETLLNDTHRNDKVIVFTQFADTALYLKEQLYKRGLRDFAVVTNGTANTVQIARRFSPSTNGGLKSDETELRVLIATDVVAEGQNLQDAHIVVNYDLPWAIIRLIQRAGRVDRIGQKHDTVLVYSFLPADGVDRIIRLRARLFQRLKENQEVIGTDESFFGEEAANKLRNIYTEKAGAFDDDEDTEDIDLASLAYHVWNNASEEDRKMAEALPPIVSATRALPDTDNPRDNPPGVITYLRYPDGSDALVRVDENGNLVSQSLSGIFRAAACPPDTPALPRAENHHDLVANCVRLAAEKQLPSGGQLGSLRSVRRKLWDRLNRYRDQLNAKPDLFSQQRLAQIEPVLDLIWRYPLKHAAQDAINRQIRLGISDEALADLVIRRAADENLCEISENTDEESPAEPQIICSMGLVRPVQDKPSSNAR